MGTPPKPPTLTKQAGSNGILRTISYSELQEHTTEDSCWVLIDGQVYDATSILDSHPGGKGVILKNAGKDATYVYRVELHYLGGL